MARPEDAFGVDMVPTVGMQWDKDPDIGGHDDGFVREAPGTGNIPATEAERDEIAARDRVRRIILAQAQRLVDKTLDSPPGLILDADEMMRRFGSHVVPVIGGYRLRLHERFIASLAAGRLNERA